MIVLIWGSSPLTRGKRDVSLDDVQGPGLIPAHAGKTLWSAGKSLIQGAHPRSRGENVFKSSADQMKAGSSPLTRGKRWCACRRRLRRGLIPAHAGKTVPPKQADHCRQAHPRSRGENSSSPSLTCLPTGSSPLTRGKPRRGRHFDLDPGLIPAHAGKTYEAHALAIQTGAHPRSRGENLRVMRGLDVLSGSSPLTRGKLRAPSSEHVFRGLIPAHAGKTMRVTVWVPLGAAHPRSRGENGGPARDGGAAQGSSPLTRGKPDERRGHALGAGLIPAHAGKTRGGRIWWRRNRAHPRSRGENGGAYLSLAAHVGSSPLTRGKPHLGHRSSTPRRLIPAHAGKTAERSSRTSEKRAHPRSRGENAVFLMPEVYTVGSSPLTRGKRGVRPRKELHDGLIPAHAGKTHDVRPAWNGHGAHPRSRGENGLNQLVATQVQGSSPLTRGKRCREHVFADHEGLIPAHAGKTG
mgnify:CR=1 FL=1